MISVAQSVLVQCWPAEQACEALVQLVRVSKISPAGEKLASPPPSIYDHASKFSIWLDEAAAQLGVEVEEIEASYSETTRMIQGIGPSLIQISSADGPCLLAVLGSRGKFVQVLSRSSSVASIPIEDVRLALCAALEMGVYQDVEQALCHTRLSPRRQVFAKQAILDHLLCDGRVAGCWTLHPSSKQRLWHKLKHAGFPKLITWMLSSQLLVSGLFLVSWWLLGSMMLAGRLELNWMIGWVLILITMIPLRIVNSLCEGWVALAAGTLLKREVLRGAMAMDPDDVRQAGAGQLLGHVMEAEIVESATLAGSFQALQGGLDFLLAATVLIIGVQNPVLLLPVVAFAAIVSMLIVQYHRQRQAWTDTRLGMTGNLIEKLAGHRTRQVQEPKERWGDGEDHSLNHYLAVSQRLDSKSITLRILIPRCWLIVGFMALVPSFLKTPDSPWIAVAVGGVLLGYQATRSLLAGVVELSAACIAWQRIRPFWDAAADCENQCDPIASALASGQKQDGVIRRVIEAKGLTYHYANRGINVLNQVDLEICTGDRVLLEGVSGAGKSTLAALLGGTRTANQGLLLTSGLDRSTIGDRAWGRKIVVAPQFHDNHVMSGTLAFNALMGREWPPSEHDLAEAERVLRGLQLGSLIDRMPAGLFQTVGETGWQLSHGEKSRLFVARALLQQSDLLVLDESFAALDPETLEQTMDFVTRECTTMMAIAHP